ncbi:MAG: hypothetical protein ABSB70_19935 [Candidatus Velthaea sp.]|jgi:hypothetical protein
MLAVVGLIVGVLTFAPGDPGLDYAVTPTSPELRALGSRLAHDLRAAGTPARYVAVTCSDAACARQVGEARHLSRVVFSSATRHMAMIWTANASVVDVATGKISGPYDIGYKGDYDAICVGLDELATAMRPALVDGTHAARQHLK